MASHASFSLKFGILTVSDTAYKSPHADKSGPHLLDLISKSHSFHASEDSIFLVIVPDEADVIEEQLRTFADIDKCDVILTTGGTGFTPRDVTPEATARVLDRRADGVSTALLLKSLEATPYAMLSRGISGVRGDTLIVNLPGSLKAVGECFSVLEPVLSHAVKQLQGRIVEVKAEHVEMQHPGLAKHRHHDHDFDQQHHHGHAHHHHHQHSVSPHQQLQQALTKSLVNESSIAGRPRQSPYPLISVDQAVATVLEAASPLAAETVSTATGGLGRILASDVVAREPLPPFRASVKDGYAVRACDGVGRRRVVDAVTAGDEASVVLQAHCAIRVSTGGPVPSGADAVVQVEDTSLLESSPDMTRELIIEVLKPATEGQDIRPVGSDIAQGATVLNAGARVGPCELGIMASIGCSQLSVCQLPTVGVASTGNELMEPFQENVNGAKIRDSNRTTLLALLSSHGFPVVDLGIIPDKADCLVNAFEKAIKACHVIVTTGGVSMGERDLVKQVLITDFNATLRFAQVCMKPGKPTSFATLSVGDRKTLFFGLPGNPVSAFVTANLYVIPACRKLAGWAEPKRAVISVKLGHDIRLDLRPEYHRCSLQWPGGHDTNGDLPVAWSTGSQLSSRLLSCQAASGLLILPKRSDWLESLPAGHVTGCLLLETP